MILHHNIDPKNPFSTQDIDAKIKQCWEDIALFKDEENKGFLFLPKNSTEEKKERDHKHIEENCVLIWLLADYIKEEAKSGIDLLFLEETMDKMIDQWDKEKGIVSSFTKDWNDVPVKSDVESAKLDDFTLALLKLYEITGKDKYATIAAEVLQFVEDNLKYPDYEIIIKKLDFATTKDNISWATIKHVMVYIEIYKLFQREDRFNPAIDLVMDKDGSNTRAESLRIVKGRILGYFEDMHLILGQKNLGFRAKATFRKGTQDEIKEHNYKLYGNSIIGIGIIKFIEFIRGHRDDERVLTQYLSDIFVLVDQLWDPQNGGFNRDLSIENEKLKIKPAGKNIASNSLVSIFLSFYIGQYLAKVTDLTNIDLKIIHQTHYLDTTINKLVNINHLYYYKYDEQWKSAGDEKRMHLLYLSLFALYQRRNLGIKHKDKIQSIHKKIELLMNDYIFLSYKHEDKDKSFVVDVKNGLDLFHFKPLLDKEFIDASQVVTTAIEEGIEKSCAIVFFITENFKDTNFLKEEVEIAKAKAIEDDSFAIIVLLLGQATRENIPKSLKRYASKKCESGLDALMEIVKALPIEVGIPSFKRQGVS